MLEEQRVGRVVVGEVEGHELSVATSVGVSEEVCLGLSECLVKVYLEIALSVR